MRRLYLLRHAKSAWPDGVADHERPLAARGREAAPLIGAFMKREGFIPQSTLVSTARRTRETFALVNETLGAPPARFTDDIYDASWDDLLQLVRGVSDEAASLMLVGHNPGMADLSEALIDRARSNPSAASHLDLKYPTAGLAVFEVKVASWLDVAPGSGNLRQFITPRLLGGVDED
ncbi:MAG: histidine phosphatase family protein [Beijerinckiaceae bacterium]|nr:histidine phosphatase family protein [Beijerinckiaceae bacterium]